MKLHHRFALSRFAACFVAVALCLSLAAPAFAQSRKERKEKASKQLVIRDKRVSKKFLKINEHLEAEEFDQARKLLDSFKLEKLKPYPRALAHQTFAFFAANDDDFEKAAFHYAKAIEDGALPSQTLLNIRFNLGQIHMMLDNWPKAIETLEAWFEDVEKPTGMAYYMLGVAYYQNDQKEQALVPAKQALVVSKNPRETWIQLVLSLHMEDRRYKEALPLLEELALRFPKKIYWVQLAAVLMELEQDEKSLAVQQLAYGQGFLEKDRELTRLAHMYLFNGLPWRAAELIDEELEKGTLESDYEAWRLYSNALLTARENSRAMEPLAKAADLAENGEGFIQLSQVHIQNEDWPKAQSALNKAFQKGDLSNPGHANLLLGIVAYQQKRFGTARSALARATRFEKTKDMASRWMQFVEREERKAEAQAAAAAATG